MTESHRSPVFLLGAGFSKAISAEMPVLDELGSAIAQRFSSTPRLGRMLTPRELRTVRSGRVPLGNVELWLSSLAVEQPFLALPRNLQRRALFVEIAVQIAEFIDDCAHRATQGPVPNWLLRLLSIWHHTESTVLTFNYDLLIESAVASKGPRVGGGAGVVRPGDITGELPPEFPEKGFFGKDYHPSFVLRKLHGSTNWWGRTSASDLFSIFRIDQLVPAWGERSPALRPVLAALTQGNERMLLPPVADKSALYANPTTSALWRSAHRALSEASELVIIGYSVPLTDASVLALLDDALSDRVRLTVVDRNAEAVVGRLSQIGRGDISAVTEPRTAGFDSLLDRFEGDIARRFDRTLFRGLHRRCYVEVATPDRLRWSVVGASTDLNSSSTVLNVAESPRELNDGAIHVSPTHISSSDARRVSAIRFANGSIARPFRGHLINNTSEQSEVTLDVSLPQSV